MFNFIDIESIIRTAGYLGLVVIIFAESGLLVGFFLPGDSLLFTAGFLASQGFLNIYILLPLLFVAAVLGNNVGYFFGKKIGPKIFSKEDSVFFHKDHLTRAEQYFNNYGSKTIILAMFIPVVRTFTPILAGVGKMNYREFFAYNLLGALLWAVGVTTLGYFLGSVVPNVDRYLLPVIILIVVVSITPTIWHILKNRKS